MFITNPYITIGWDNNALQYISSVEQADQQPLEYKTRIAYNNFIKGCKSDGIWNAIKASCILAGARTLSGALVPLVGSAPTNNNFVTGDYNRKTGLKGDGLTKYININRNNNLDPNTNRHFSIWATDMTTTINRVIFGGGWSSNGGNELRNGATTSFNTRISSSASVATSVASSFTTGLKGCFRNNSSNYTFRNNLSNTLITNTVSNVASGQTAVFAGINSLGTVSTPWPGRLSFYSIGESLDLALLDARVSTLMTDLAAAIP